MHHLSHVRKGPFKRGRLFKREPLPHRYFHVSVLGLEYGEIRVSHLLHGLFRIAGVVTLKRVFKRGLYVFGNARPCPSGKNNNREKQENHEKRFYLHSPHQKNTGTPALTVFS